MIWRRRPAAPPPADPWEEEGRRLAPLFSGTSSAVVVATDPEVAARVALGLARSAALERHVAIADLTGASPTLAALAGSTEGHGITDSFLYGVSLNAVARPAADGTPSLFVLPCGSETVVPEEVFHSDRWQRLAAGFAEAGALLLLVASAGTPGLGALVPQTDGAISVGDAVLPLEWRVLAQAGDRLPITALPAATEPQARPPWSPKSVASATLLGVTILIAIASLWPHGDPAPVPRPPVPGAAVANAPVLTAPATAATPAPVPSDSVVTVSPEAPANAPESAPETAPAPPPAAPRAAAPGTAKGTTKGGVVAASPAAPAAAPVDTLAVLPPVNPSDATIAAEFTVELVATNTAAGANSWLRERGLRLPAVTVAPVLLGTGRLRWYKVLAGASRHRPAADSLLSALRRAGVVRADAGVVVRAPFALLLEAGVPRGAAPGRVAALMSRGVPAYALLQDDGTTRLYAGAFETTAAAVLLDADLRAAGLAPQVAFRTGRTF